MSEKREGEGAAQASSVGSLLTDLLSEAKKDVAAERQQLERKLHAKESEEREAEVREEARKREAMQQKLIEETRLRSIAMQGAKRGRSDTDRVPMATAPHVRPQVPDAAQGAPLGAGRIPAAGRGGVSRLLMAALVIAGVAVGLGGAFALSPTPKVHLPDIDAAAKALVAQTAKAASAEGQLATALGESNGKIAVLERQMGEMVAAQRQLAVDLEATRTELAETQQALADAQAGRPATVTPAVRRGPRGGTTSDVPNINTGVFRDKNK